MIPRYGEWEQRFASQGLTVIGIHAPETAAERDVARLRAYAREHRIEWTVLLDPQFDAWNRFHVEAWPTIILFDRAGTIRSVYVGDNRSPSIERDIQQLLRE